MTIISILQEQCLSIFVETKTLFAYKMAAATKKHQHHQTSSNCLRRRNGTKQNAHYVTIGHKHTHTHNLKNTKAGTKLRNLNGLKILTADRTHDNTIHNIM